MSSDKVLILLSKNKITHKHRHSTKNSQPLSTKLISITTFCSQNLYQTHSKPSYALFIGDHNYAAADHSYAAADNNIAGLLQVFISNTESVTMPMTSLIRYSINTSKFTF